MLFKIINLIILGLTKNISQTLFTSCPLFLRGSFFRDSCVIPILYEDAPNYIANRKGRKEHKERDQEI